jgi:diacylglycerol kinase (ATP)
MKPGASGATRLLNATRWSFRGLRSCWRNEAAFRQEVVLVGVLLPLAFLVARNAVQWLLLVTPLFALLAVELLNSAIESVVDRIGDGYHELSGRAKDMGSAAVFVCLSTAALAWLAILFQNLAG